MTAFTSNGDRTRSANPHHHDSDHALYPSGVGDGVHRRPRRESSAETGNGKEEDKTVPSRILETPGGVVGVGRPTTTESRKRGW